MRIHSNGRTRAQISGCVSAAAGRASVCALLAAAALAGGQAALAQDGSGRVHVRRIELDGVVRTADHVLRRELVQLEGAVLNTAALDESLRRLRRLAFIERVDAALRPVPGSPDMVDVVLTVDEAPARRWGGGGGWSESLRASARAYYTDENFLGSGQRIAVSAEGSDLRSSIELSHTTPRIGTSEVGRSIELSSRRIDRLTRHASAVETDLTSLTLEFGYPLAGGGASTSPRTAVRTAAEREALLPTAEVRERLAALGDVLDALRPSACCGSLRLGVALRRADIAQVSRGSSQFAQWIAEHGGTSARAAELDELDFQLRYRRDTRDRAQFPERGVEHRVSFTAALPGSDIEYLLADYTVSAYRPIGRRWTLRTLARLGYGVAYGDTSSIPPYLNWFGGGPMTVRGYRENTLGPRDTLGNPYGGNLLVAARVELMTPWPGRWGERVRFGAFADAGNVFSTQGVEFSDAAGRRLDYGFDASALRRSVGIAAEVAIRLGTVRLSYAVPLGAEDKHPNPFLRDEVDRLQISLGVGF